MEAHAAEFREPRWTASGARMGSLCEDGYTSAAFKGQIRRDPTALNEVEWTETD